MNNPDIGAQEAARATCPLIRKHSEAATSMFSFLLYALLIVAVGTGVSLLAVTYLLERVYHLEHPVAVSPACAPWQTLDCNR